MNRPNNITPSSEVIAAVKHFFMKMLFWNCVFLFINMSVCITPISSCARYAVVQWLAFCSVCCRMAGLWQSFLPAAPVFDSLLRILIIFLVMSLCICSACVSLLCPSSSLPEHPAFCYVPWQWVCPVCLRVWCCMHYTTTYTTQKTSH